MCYRVAPQRKMGNEHHAWIARHIPCASSNGSTRRYVAMISMWIEVERWGDARAKLLQPEQWEGIRAQICQTLGREMEASRVLEQLGQQVEEAYQRVAAHLPTNTALRIEQQNGVDVPNLERLERVAEPESLRLLRASIGASLPLIDLPEVILEVAQHTGFLSQFTHVSDSNAYVEDLDLSLSAVLLAEACNIGLTPVIHPEIPALTRDRLSWVRHHFVRAETITRANACLVQAQRDIPLAQIWGGGYVASVDGLRFVVPVRSVNTGPNPRYFGQGRGVTYLNYTSDQFTGLGGLVIPGTIRDSVYVLEALLEQESGLMPTEIMSDSGSYSDLMFGLFWYMQDALDEWRSSGQEVQPEDVERVAPLRFQHINVQGKYHF